MQLQPQAPNPNVTKKRVLMVAYHFPPLAGSSGIQRALRLVQQLPDFGWEPLVLTASPRAYEHTNTDLEADIPPGTVVRRALALDTARHLSLRGRYVGAMARPDRWVSWRFDAVRQGMQLIREFRPQAIWSTYPIATAHLIGAELQRRSGLPWIADFRDPMAQDGYPADPLTREQFLRIEERAVQRAAALTFTTPGAARMYRQRYAQAAQRISVLENGYDEESFAEAERANAAAGATGPLDPATPVLLHSGIVYPAERDPTQLFAALRQLLAAGRIRPGDLRVRFRASVHDDLLQRLAREQGVEAFIETCPPLPYKAALQEMLRADALLVLQASNCNEQVPAKVYEYLRAGRPVLCLSDPAGDTATVLRQAGVPFHARLDAADDIAALLLRVVPRLRGAEPLGGVADAQRYSRRGRTAALAHMLEELAPATRPAAAARPA